MTDLIYQPLDRWPGKLRKDHERKRAQFGTPHAQTVELLKREVGHVADYRKAVVVEVAIPREQWRLDGTPRMRHEYVHPGIVLSFESARKDEGALQFYTDLYTDWKDNLRAVALGLEAMRKIERYGLGNGREQYTGFKALGSGIAMGPASVKMTADEAMRLLAVFAKLESPELEMWLACQPGERFAGILESVRRRAASLQHPDRNPFNDAAENMIQINIAYDLLKGLQ